MKKRAIFLVILLVIPVVYAISFQDVFDFLFINKISGEAAGGGTQPPPTITITYPINNAYFSNPIIAVTGTSYNTNQIQVRLNNEQFENAQGLNPWTHTIIG